MMMWNKIKMTVAVMCVFGLTGVGAGWLTHGRAGVEAAPAVAEKPPEQGLPRPAELDREQELRKEIDLIQARLEKLASVEEKEAEHLSEQIIETRLRLVELQDELRIRELEGQLEYEGSRIGLKDALRRMSLLEATLQSYERSGDNAKKAADGVKKQLQSERETLDREQNNFMARKIERAKGLRPIRKEVYQAEEALRRLEIRQTRQGEEFAEKRQALFARLQQLDHNSFRPEPADRLRDVERKLDALRRDVNELRRAVERQNDEPRKKP